MRQNYFEFFVSRHAALNEWLKTIRSCVHPVLYAHVPVSIGSVSSFLGRISAGRQPYDPLVDSIICAHSCCLKRPNFMPSFTLHDQFCLVVMG